MTGDIGGYQADHSTTFGVGTLKPCPHRTTTVFDGTFWHITGHSKWDVYPVSTFGQPGDTVGTIRCLGCGNKVES